MNDAYLLIGGNIGDRQENLKLAKNLVAKYCGKIVKSSSLYETAAWGKTDQPPFLNQAIEIETSLAARELMEAVLAVENKMGRERKEKYGPRIIDIDVLFFNDERYDDLFLKVPHPDMQNRRFVLVPLEEIAANVQHPILKKSIRQLLKECPDRLQVKKYREATA